MLETWSTEKTFEKSVEEREGAKPFVFYEGPPQRMDCQVFTT